MMYQSLLISLLLNTACIFTDAMKMIKDAKYLGQDYYELTSGTTGTGGIWSEDKIDVTKDFTISAQVYLGHEESKKGSQGIAFVIQGIGAHHSNLNGNGRLGYANINSVLAVEIDTSSQGAGSGTGLNNYDDIAHDHMQIRCTGDKNEWYPVSEAVAIGKGPDGADGGVEDNNYHSFRVEYTADDHILTVYFDNVMKITQQLDKEGFKHYIGRYLRNNLVTVGFTASHSRERGATGSGNSQRVRFSESGESYQGAGSKKPARCMGQTARWSGDPHFYTFDGVKYDCQGAGEFVVSKSLYSDFEIHGRFEPISKGSRVTVTRGVAFNTGGVDEPSVALTVPESTDGDQCEFTMFVDREEMPQIGGLDGIARVTSSTQSKSNYINFEYMQTGVSISVTAKKSRREPFGCVMSVQLCLPSDITDNANIVGLLGTPDITTSDWMTTEGESLTIPTKKEDLVFGTAYDYCVENWCVADQSDSMFQYENAVKGFDHYNKCSSEYDTTLEDMYEGASTEEIESCNGEIDCEIELLIGGVESAEDLADVNEGFDTIKIAPTEEQKEIPDVYQGGSAKTRPPEEPNDPPADEGTDEGGNAKTSPAEPNDPSADDGSYAGGNSKTRNDESFMSAIFGDPHFKTWSGLKYDYHGICDLVMLNHPTFNGNLGMKIHVRSMKTRKWSYVSNAVVLIGKDSFEVAGKSGGNTQWMNTIEVKRDDWDKNPVEISGFPVSYKKLHSNQHEYTINIGDKEYIKLKTWKDMVRVDIVVNRNINTFDGSLGLLGSYPEGTMLGRDGKTAISEYSKFGQEWQVLSSEPMIFHVVDGPQHPSKCEVPTKTVMRTRLAESIISREEAEIACGKIGVNEDEFDLCVFDVMAIGDKNAAGAY